MIAVSQANRNPHLDSAVDRAQGGDVRFSVREAPLTHSNQLAIQLSCDRSGKTIVQQRYMVYPLSISPVFRREADNPGANASQRELKALRSRAYLFRMNTSPGLLAGDELGISLRLGAGSQLYLADQSATKVHQMPQPGTQARVRYDIALAAGATLEFFPEPLILFAESDLTQTTDITAHPDAALSLAEIILPGRLARGESYQFRQFMSRIRVSAPTGELWFQETMKLTGQDNRFVTSALFASGPVLGGLLLLLPSKVPAAADELKALGTEIEQQVEAGSSLSLASSILPGERGLFIRAIAGTTREMQAGFKGALNCVRRHRNQAPLPYSV